MPRTLAFLILTGSPLVISVGIGVLGTFIHAVGRGFGSTRQPTAIIIAMLGLAAVHAGYYLAPMLWASERRTLALWLTAPIAAAAILGSIPLLASVLPNSARMTDDLPRAIRWFALCVAGWITYGAPIVVLALRPASAVTAP